MDCCLVDIHWLKEAGFQTLTLNRQMAPDFFEEFPCLVHKLSVILTALDYKPQ